MKTGMTIGILNGFWSTNIGNSFFQLGAQHVVKRLFPDAKVLPVPDVMGYVAPHNANENRILELVQHLELDYLVLLGPFLRKDMMTILHSVLQNVQRNGTKLIALSAATMDSGPSTGDVERFFGENRFEFITTRENSTADLLEKHAPNTPVLRGIDLAFFISDAIEVPRVRPDFAPYISLVFDQTPEPKISATPFEGAKEIRTDSATFYLGNRQFSSESKLSNFARRFFSSYRASTGAVGDLKVLRSDHRFNPFLSRKIFSKQNTFSLDTPEGYLTLYANSETVVSNRVHACVAGLSYGGRSILYSKSSRSDLFEAVVPGCSNTYPIDIDAKSIGLEGIKAAFLRDLKAIAANVN